jgi:hypothetical protein
MLGIAPFTEVEQTTRICIVKGLSLLLFVGVAGQAVESEPPSAGCCKGL